MTLKELPTSLQACIHTAEPEALTAWLGQCHYAAGVLRQALKPPARGHRDSMFLPQQLHMLDG